MSTTIATPTSLDRWTATVRGDRIAFARVQYDDERPDHPFDDKDWCYIVHRNQRMGDFNVKEVEDRIVNDRDAVVISAYQHGDILWFVRGTHNPPDMRWDGCWDAGVFVPGKSMRAHCNAKHWKQGSPERTAYMRERAIKACAVYTAYCNGEIYRYEVEVFRVQRDDADVVLTDYVNYYGDPYETDSCGGYYELTDAADAAAEAADYHLGR